jgi:hypothetical protein
MASFFFLALGLGDDDHRLEAHRVADERETDAGIARRAFNDRATFAQQAALDGIAHDEQRSAVFHRLAGIEELGLAPDFAAREFGRAVQPDQRGVADGGEDV